VSRVERHLASSDVPPNLDDEAHRSAYNEAVKPLYLAALCVMVPAIFCSLATSNLLLDDRHNAVEDLKVEGSSRIDHT
jgi:hypothetical protein